MMKSQGAREKQYEKEKENRKEGKTWKEGMDEKGVKEKYRKE